MALDGTLNNHLLLQGDPASALATAAASPGSAAARGFGHPLPAPSGGPRSGAPVRGPFHPPGVGVTRLLAILAALGGLCGVAALLLGAVGLPVTVTPPELAARLYTQVSIHLWYLEMILLLVGLAIGVLGILGYQAIREAAITAARAEANRIAVRQISDLGTGPGAGLPRTDDDDLPVSFGEPES